MCQSHYRFHVAAQQPVTIGSMSSSSRAWKTFRLQSLEDLPTHHDIDELYPVTSPQNPKDTKISHLHPVTPEIITFDQGAASQ